MAILLMVDADGVTLHDAIFFDDIVDADSEAGRIYDATLGTGITVSLISLI